MNQNNRSLGFTLVELLAVVVIMGILSTMSIVAVSKIIDKSREEYSVQQEKMVIMACENYLKQNTKYMPKAIGEEKEIQLKTLKAAKYLKEDVINSSGESCMENSYILVYKKSLSEYEYDVHMLCGSDSKDDITNTLPVPNVQIQFKDANKGYKDLILVLEIFGSEDESSPAEISGYSFTINSDDSTIFNSGALTGGGNTELTIEKRLSDMVDQLSLCGTSTSVIFISVNVSVTNSNKKTETFNQSLEVKCS